ncbi:replication initiation factor family protein, partial [human gut metagenome]
MTVTTDTVKERFLLLEKNLVTESIYIGSRAENAQSLLRVYDKKSEQISNNGFRLDEALQCDSWVRFEASYRGNYAHQITEQLEHITDDVSVSQF